MDIVEVNRRNVILSRSWWAAQPELFKFQGVNIAECLEYSVISLLNQFVWERLHAANDNRERGNSHTALIETIGEGASPAPTARTLVGVSGPNGHCSPDGSVEYRDVGIATPDSESIPLPTPRGDVSYPEYPY